MEKNEYMNLKIDLGALGEVELLVFPNNNKEKDTHPDVSVSLKQMDKLKKCGAGWINTKKETIQAPKIEFEHKPE